MLSLPLKPPWAKTVFCAATSTLFTVVPPKAPLCVLVLPPLTPPANVIKLPITVAPPSLFKLPFPTVIEILSPGVTINAFLTTKSPP